MLADWYFRGLVSSAWAQVNIKDQFLTPKNVDPGQTGVGSSLVCHFEEKQDKKGNAPKSTLVSSTWAQGKISTISTVSSGQTKNTKTILIFANFKMIVSLIFVIACQTNTWTSTFVFRGLKPNIIFEASSPNVLCLIPSCDLRTIFLFMIFSVKPHHIARTDRNS